MGGEESGGGIKRKKRDSVGIKRTEEEEWP